MIEHGRRTCKAPQALCPTCVLRRSCPKIGVPVEDREGR
jgi:endonuclease III